MAQGGKVKRSKANIAVGAIVAFVLAAAVGAVALMQAGASPGSETAEAKAVVHDGDGGIHELALSHDAELPVTTSLGTNVVVVEDGAVYVREADCQNGDCIRQGAIDAPGRQIICLPHKLWIEVVADGRQGGSMDVDAVAQGDDAGERGLDAVAR